MISENDWEKLQVGSVVMVRPCFGMMEPVEVVVINKDIHKGKPVIDYSLSPESTQWAYMRQIDRIVSL